MYRTTYWRTLSEWNNRSNGDWKYDFNGTIMLMSLTLLMGMYADRRE